MIYIPIQYVFMLNAKKRYDSSIIIIAWEDNIPCQQGSRPSTGVTSNV